MQLYLKCGSTNHNSLFQVWQDHHQCLHQWTQVQTNQVQDLNRPIRARLMMTKWMHFEKWPKLWKWLNLVVYEQFLIFFVTCHFRHMSRDESFLTWHNESLWLMSHVTKFTILNSFTNSIKDLSSSRVFYLQRFNWLRFEFRLRRPIMINLLEPIRIIRLRRLKFRLDPIL